MFEGKTNAAMKLLGQQSKRGVLPLPQSTINELKQKYPEASEGDPSLLIDEQPPFVDPVVSKYNSLPLQMQHYGQRGLAGEKRKPPWLGKFPVTDFYVG